MKLNTNKTESKHLLLFVFLSCSFFTSCQKELENKQTPVTLVQKFEKPTRKTNPFSLANISKAKAKLAESNANNLRSSSERNNEQERLYTYIKFNGNAVTGTMLKQLEADSSIQIMDFPFANGELYNDEFALDEEKAKLLADGSLYVVTKKSSTSETLITNNTALNAQVLDELYLPDEEDTTLQFQAFREAGYTETMIERIRLCLLKRPQGFVRYLDSETNQLRGVPGMQVWGMVFGIRMITYTDQNGFYRFPWRFNGGTIMGTKAKNPRVNIKPLNTQGAWWLTIPFQFIVGSVHIKGWVGSCQMNSDVNFHFETHRQNRLWAQLMHAVTLHDSYSDADGILAAPLGLTVYAHWDDNYGNASAPMLGQLTANPYALVVEYYTLLLNGNNPNNYPNLFNLLTGLLPDITVKVGSTERRSYSARLMQTAFHELGHASHFRRAGTLYWIDLIGATLFPTGNCGGYGCGTGSDDGNVAVAESWAEFIGTNHALRNHPNGQKVSVWAGGFIRFDVALEQEPWFFNNWIPTGVYNDLIDVVNTDPNENIWDITGGLTIQQLYEVLGPDVDFMCEYMNLVIRRYPALNPNDINEIFERNNHTCR